MQGGTVSEGVLAGTVAPTCMIRSVFVVAWEHQVVQAEELRFETGPRLPLLVAHRMVGRPLGAISRVELLRLGSRNRPILVTPSGIKQFAKCAGSGFL